MKCELCGEPMPPGEEMFKYHGYSGDCPKPPLPTGKTTQQAWGVWVKVGVNAHGDFIEDVTIRDSIEKPGYVRGTLTLDDLLAKVA